MRAYSYVRWSSAKQTQGDSLRRQTEKAERYVKEHGLTLDPTRRVDAGVSAFKGKNAVEGELGAFLKAIDEGKIETPCYLIVEALDRITRKEITDALALFLSIIQRGVTIVTLEPEQTFSRDTINANGGTSLMIAVSILVGGHEDSKKRGVRVREAWDKKRELQKQGVIASAKGPSWLKLSADRKKWIVIESKAKIVRKIYELALEGWGAMRIATHFNENNEPFLSDRVIKDNETGEPIQRYWTHGNVGALLQQPAVYGLRKQTHGKQADEDHYPTIVSKEIYSAVQAGRIGRQGKGGAHQEASNLFAGMCYCAYCGSRTRYSVSGVKSNRIAYLRCLNATAKGGCTAAGMPYSLMEQSVLNRLINVQIRSLSPKTMQRERDGRITLLEAKLATLNKQMENLVQLAKDSPDVTLLFDEVRKLKNEIDVCKNELGEVRGKQPLTEQEIDDHTSLFIKLTKGGNDALRKQVQVALRRQLQKIEIAPRMDEMVGFERDVETWTKNGKYKWSENPIHVAILTYAGGSVRAVECTHISSMS